MQVVLRTSVMPMKCDDVRSQWIVPRFTEEERDPFEDRLIIHISGIKLFLHSSPSGITSCFVPPGNVSKSVHQKFFKFSFFKLLDFKFFRYLL